jgi:hypothetical protein
MPLGVNLDYLTDIAPTGMFRTYVRAAKLNGDVRSGNTHTYKVSVGGGAEQTFSVKESKTYTEIVVYTEDVKDRVNGITKLTITPAASTRFHLSPLEYLVDMPIDLGCFQIPGDVGTNSGRNFFVCCSSV